MPPCRINYIIGELGGPYCRQGHRQEPILPRLPAWITCGLGQDGFLIANLSSPASEPAELIVRQYGRLGVAGQPDVRDGRPHRKG